MSDIYCEQIPQTNAMLGRHIEHDPNSKNYPLPKLAAPTKDIQWATYGPILNQGPPDTVPSLGACTGFAAAHIMNTDPLYSVRISRGENLLTNRDAIEMYSRATIIDPFPGSYPPTDTGSSGLAVMRVMHSLGLIKEYRWAFGIDGVLGALNTGPLCVGTIWRESMSRPNRSGLVKPSGAVVGGHEYCVTGFQKIGRRMAKNLLWCRNSWGWWGNLGGFCITVSDFEDLLDRDGDAVRPIVS